MRLFLDLDTRSFIESAQFQRAVSSLVLKRRDHLPVDVQFLRSGVVVELATGATGKLGLKADKDFNGSFAASDLEWAKSGTGDATTYRFDLNLNTVQINALFAGIPTPASVSLMLEIEWAEGDLRTSSNTLAVTLENDIVRGDEGAAEEGGPVYPLPGAIELIARKGQNSGYAGLDASGKVPVAQLPHTSASLYETPNRFTADRTGWKVGDIIRQSGDSTAASLGIEVTSPVPGGTQEVVEITASDVPEGATAGFQLNSNFGSSSWMDQSGPLSAADYATAIKNFLDGDCSWLGSAAINGAVVTFTFNSFGSASASVAGDYAGLSVVTPGVYQLEFGFYGDFYDQSGNYYSAYAGVYGPMPAEGFAQEIANSLTNNIPFLNVTVNGTVVSATFNFSGQLPSQPNFYDPSGNGQLWQASFTDGVSGVPQGTFLVSDISALGNAGGYKGIGDTVDFLSGYGAPSSSVGSLGNGYVDLNNGNFYHRSDSGWFFVLNIKGPQGQQGPQGPQGATGATGPAGVAGVSGKLARIAMQRAFHLPPQSVALSFTPSKGCFDGAFLWVTSGTSLAKIDARAPSVTGTYSISVGASCQDVCFDGSNLWFTNGTATIFKVNGSTGAAIGSYTLGGVAASLCFDGTNLWVGHNGVSSLTLSKINIATGAVVATYNIADSHYIMGAFSTDGVDLFIPCDWTGAAPGICRVRISDGVRVATHSMPNNFNLNTSTYDGSFLWQTGGVSSTHTVFKVNPVTGAFMGALPDNSLSWPYTVVATDERIFISAGSKMVRSYDKATLALKNTCTLPSNVTCLVSDGTYVWAGQTSAMARIDTLFP